VRYEKDGANMELTVYQFDDSDDYSDHCPDAWTYKGCTDFNIQYAATLKQDSIVPGVPDDDVTSESKLSFQSPVCAPDSCFDSLPDIVDDLNDFFETVVTTLNADPAYSAKGEFDDITVAAGFCWPRWYNMIFMTLGTLLCLACSAHTAKKLFLTKRVPAAEGSAFEPQPGSMYQPQPGSMYQPS
jgi:hypothetical protein